MKRKSSGQRNDDRANGKAWKKKPKKNKSTGKTIDGYSPAKLAIRKAKRPNALQKNSL